MIPRLFASVSLLACLAVAPEATGQELVDIYVAKEREQLWLMPPFQRGLAVARDRSIWVMFVLRSPQGQRLVVVGSRDGGKTFGAPIDIGSGTGKQGSIVADVARPVLHVAWTGNGGAAGDYLGVFYQKFDCEKGRLVGRAELLLKGSSANDQFHAADIEMSAGGDLALTVFTHRSPDQTVWKSGWAAGLLLRRSEAKEWSEPILINQGFSGINPNVQAVGERLSVAYRSFGTGSYGIYSREFDVRRSKWIDAKEIPVQTTVSKNGTSLQPTNTGCIGSDLSGNLYVLHTTGSNSTSGRSGSLQMSFRRAGSTDAKRRWTTVPVTADPPQSGGNYNPVHYSLARGPGNQMLAIYSKKSEAHAKLYTRVFDNGSAVIKERVVATGIEGAFAAVNGLRSSQADTTLLAAVLGKTKAAPRGRIAILVPRLPVRTFWRK